MLLCLLANYTLWKLKFKKNKIFLNIFKKYKMILPCTNYLFNNNLQKVVPNQAIYNANKSTLFL